MTTRRQVVLVLGASAVAAPLASFAQPVRRIGFLGVGAPPAFGPQRGQQRLRESLQRLGYEVGKNLLIETRYADGNLEQLSTLAEDLVRLKVELIVAPLNIPIAAAKRATHTIPIVMHVATNPVENGFVETLGRPGGNITGTMWSGPELAGKIVQILKEAAPGVVKVAGLHNPNSPGVDLWRVESRLAAKALGVSLQEFPITRVEDIASALDQIAAFRPGALIVWGDPISNAHAHQIANFATKRKLISIGTSSIFVEAGGLIFYGPDIAEAWDRTASFIDRILRGAKAADLPVEGPKKYELVMSSKAARSIRFKPLQSFAQRVDRVVE